MERTARSRARRLAFALGKGALLSLVFVVTLVVAALVHVDTPRGRRLVAVGVTAALQGQFRGRFVVDRVGHVGLDGVSGLDARLLSDTGEELVSARGLAARADVPTLTRGVAAFAVGAKTTLVIDLDEVSADHLAIDAGRDSTSSSKLLRALESPRPTEPSAGPGPRVDLRRMHVHHAWIFGSPADGVALDVEIAPVVGHMTLADGALALDVEELRVDARNALRGERATLKGLGRVQLRGRPMPDARILFAAGTSTLTIFGEASLFEGRATVRAHVPPVPGSALATLVPGLSPRGDVSATIEAEGDTSRSRARLSLAVEGGRLEATALGAMGGRREVQVGATLRDAELATFAPGAPPSRLGADLSARARFPLGARPTAVARLEVVAPSHISGIALPRATIDASLDDAGDLRAHLVADDPGVTLSAHASLPRALAAGSAGKLSFDAEAHVSLGDASRLGRLGRGAVDLGGRGTVDLASQTIDAALDASATQLSIGGAKARGATLSAHVTGAARAPRIVAALRASDLGAGLAHLDALEVTTTATTSGKIGLADTRLTMASNGTVIRASSPTMTLAPYIDVPSLTITGIGEPVEASLSRAGGVTRVVARTEGIDLAHLATPLHLRGLSGRLALSADTTLTEVDAEGAVHARLSGGALPGIPHADVAVDVSLRDRLAVATIDASLGDTLVARADVKGVRLAGPAQLPSSWSRATGTGAFDVRADLDALTRLFAPTGLPVAPLAGTAHVQGSFAGDGFARAPSISLAVDTSGLELLVARGSGAPLRVAGFDTEATVRLDGATGFLAGFARTYDRHGEVAAIDAKGTLPLDALLSGDMAQARARLLGTQLAARVTLSPRDLGAWPRELLPLPLAATGRVGAIAVLEGTPSSPRITLDVRGSKLGVAGARATNDMVLSAGYDGTKAFAEAVFAGAPRGRATVRLDALVPLAPWLAGQPGETIPWSAGGQLTLEAFALEALPPIGDDRVRGSVDGTLTLSKLHDDATLDVDLRLTDAGIADARVAKTAVRLRSGKGRAEGSIRVEQSDGYLEGSVALGLDWGARLTPTVDTRRALDAHLVAKAFRLAPLRPFVASALADLDGRLDADAHVVADPTGTDVRMSGGAQLRDVGFVATALGQELREVGAKAEFLPGGVVEITGITASDGAGRIEGAARARFDGQGLAGANARFEIAKSRPFDVMLGGQTLGNVYGRADVSVRRTAQATRVSVDLPSLHVRLSDLAGKAVQELPLRADIKVGVLRRGALVDARPPKPSRDSDDERRSGGGTLDLTVKLGSDVDVRRGAMVTVQVTGEPRVHVEGGTTAIAGAVQLVSGSLDLQGKKFSIERGTVTFDPQDPANPVVLATASWTAKDRTRVIADFVGPVKTGKVTLRSEPSRPQSEILQLIVFGTADGFNAAPSAGQKPDATTRAAAAFGGNALAQGLDSALDGLTGLTTQTRIDTTSANNPRPELEVQVARDIWLKFAYVLGTPPIHEPDKSLGSVVVRFAPNWTLSTTVGDRGKATMDTVWQYRY